MQAKVNKKRQRGGEKNFNRIKSSKNGTRLKD